MDFLARCLPYRSVMVKWRRARPSVKNTDRCTVAYRIDCYRLRKGPRCLFSSSSFSASCVCDVRPLKSPSCARFFYAAAEMFRGCCTRALLIISKMPIESSSGGGDVRKCGVTLFSAAQSLAAIKVKAPLKFLAVLRGAHHCVVILSPRCPLTQILRLLS